MDTVKKVLKFLGGKTLYVAKAGSNAINVELNKRTDEKKRQDAIYKEEYEKAFREGKDEALRKKAREDAHKKLSKG